MSQMNENEFIIIKTKEDQACGIFCQVCDFLIKSADDSNTYKTWNTCHDCFLRFIEARKIEWSNGWRPDKEDVESLYSEKSRIFIK